MLRCDKVYDFLPIFESNVGLVELKRTPLFKIVCKIVLPNLRNRTIKFIEIESSHFNKATIVADSLCEHPWMKLSSKGVHTMNVLRLQKKQSIESFCQPFGRSLYTFLSYNKLGLALCTESFLILHPNFGVLVLKDS